MLLVSKYYFFTNDLACDIALFSSAKPVYNSYRQRLIPKSYICCSGFGDSQFKAQKSPATWDYHEIMKGHDVMITAPEELTQLLDVLAKNES